MGVSEESKGKMKQVLSEIRVASSPAAGPEPVKIFVSYSQEDLDLVTVLDRHLSALRREGLISLWIDREIGPGQEWREAIDQNINDAAIILLMISSSFIASEYCWDVELRQALERHAAGSARVIPVILRDCDWHHLPFSKLQALPTAARPIVKWPDPDSGFADVSRGIRRAVLTLRD
ncbi:toll/interleukin-1 receptor domain-containing protein [Streptomyces sp. NPDC052107]|uniref:toll/interleukin-1 receptor domain-containing protein n=1 Tax=Streptomyces sp. NPDC052107 TaxID=3155632 RepID=UPI00342E7E6D